MYASIEIKLVLSQEVNRCSLAKKFIRGAIDIKLLPRKNVEIVPVKRTILFTNIHEKCIRRETQNIIVSPKTTSAVVLTPDELLILHNTNNTSKLATQFKKLKLSSQTNKNFYVKSIFSFKKSKLSCFLAK